MATRLSLKSYLSQKQGQHSNSRPLLPAEFGQEVPKCLAREGEFKIDRGLETTKGKTSTIVAFLASPLVVRLFSAQRGGSFGNSSK